MADQGGTSRSHEEQASQPASHRKSLERRASGRMTPEQVVEEEAHTIDHWKLAATKKKAADAAVNPLVRGWSKLGAFQRSMGIRNIVASGTDEPEVLRAARSGDLQMMHYALASFEKAAVDAARVKETGESALMIVASRGDAEMTKMLLDAGANVNNVNFNGETALMMACDNASIDVVRLLLQYEASRIIRNNKGETALDYAARTERMDIFRLLEERDDVTDDATGPEVLTNHMKLGDKCPWMELVKKSSKPVHACLLLAERFKDLSGQGQAERNRVFESLTKDCITYGRTILSRYYSRMKDEKTQQLLFNQVVGGRSCMMIAAESRFVDFMADDVVQHIVRMLWIGEAGVFETLSMSILFRPWSRPFSYWQDPACFFATARGKFAFSTILYVLFLGLFTWVINLHPVSVAPTPMEWAMYYCVMGFIMHEVKQFREAGFRGYFSQTWNKMDSTMYAIFVTCLALRIVGFIDVANRQEWAQQVMRLMAYNSIFLWMRLLQLCLLDSTLGPLLSMIGNMIRNIFNFMTILGVILLGFGQTFYTLLREDAKYTEDYLHTVLNLFGSLLGTTFGFEDNIAAYSVFGRVLLEIFLMMGSVLLLNLLIAILTNTYAAVKEVSDSEYKYGLAETVLEKIEDSLVVPPPLNAIRFTFLFVPMRFVVGMISALMLLFLLPCTVALAVYYVASGQKNRVAAFIRTKPDFSFPVETVKDDDDDNDDGEKEGEEKPASPESPQRATEGAAGTGAAAGAGVAAAAAAVPGQGAPSSSRPLKYHELPEGKDGAGSGRATPASVGAAPAAAPARTTADEWGAFFDDGIDYSTSSESELDAAGSLRSARSVKSGEQALAASVHLPPARSAVEGANASQQQRRRERTGRRERAEIAAQLVEVQRKLALLMQHAGIADGAGPVAVPILDPAPISPHRPSRSSSRSAERGTGPLSGRISPAPPQHFFGGATPGAGAVTPGGGHGHHRHHRRSRDASPQTFARSRSSSKAGLAPTGTPPTGHGAPAPSPAPVAPAPVRAFTMSAIVSAARSKAGTPATAPAPAAPAPPPRDSSLRSSSDGTLRIPPPEPAPAAAPVRGDVGAGLEGDVPPPIAVIDADASRPGSATGRATTPPARRARSEERTAGRSPPGDSSGGGYSPSPRDRTDRQPLLPERAAAAAAGVVSPPPPSGSGSGRGSSSESGQEGAALIAAAARAADADEDEDSVARTFASLAFRNVR